MPQPSDPHDIPVSTDTDYEVKLLVERSGCDLSVARRLIEQTGSFADAMRSLGLEPQAAAAPPGRRQ